MRVIVFGILSVFLLAVPASAQVLWQNVSVGMTADQIRAAQPAVAVPTERSTLHSGAICELQLRGYEVQGDSFDVCFFLQDHRLIQVMMSAQRASRSAFDSFAALLRARYGREVSPNAAPCRIVSADFTSCGIDWLLPSGVNVSLNFLAVRGTEDLLKINYQVRLRREGDRL
jgi:hypothetical protein